MNFKISIAKDKNNINDILYIDNQPIYSIYSLEKQIKRQIDSQLKSNTKNIILFGIGLGWHLEYITNNFSNINVFAFEPIAEVYNLFNSKYYEQLKIANINFKIFFYKSADELLFQFDKYLSYRNFNNLAIINIYQSIKNCEPLYSEFIAVLRTAIDTKHKNFWTSLMFSELWQNNITENFKYLSESYPIELLFNKFDKIPALIIAAGPSLDKSIDEIKKYQEKFIIIAVDTALRTLIKNNIKPDFVITLDAQKYNFKDFEGIDYSDIILVYEMTVYPEILRNYNGKKKICYIIGRHFKDFQGQEYLKFEPLIDFLADCFEFPGYLQTGGSVSTVAFDLARRMNCDPIVFIGQDLAYSDFKLHTSNAFDMLEIYKTQSKFQTIETFIFSHFAERSLMPVKGNYSDIVFTDLTLKHYLNWLADGIQKMRQKVLNATLGGAYIPHTEIKRLSEFSDKYKTLNKKEMFRLTDKIKINDAALKLKLNNMLQKFSVLLDDINECIEITKDSNIPMNSNEKSELLFQKKKELLTLNLAIFDVYIDKYYWTLKDLQALNLNEDNYLRYDYQLFFMILQDGLIKIINILKKILSNYFK
ncbi:MAG TPA: DUF115 domain-containing protein [bacterium]|nr:DUF115 domain-containing protein [bacterium]